MTLRSERSSRSSQQATPQFQSRREAREYESKHSSKRKRAAPSRRFSTPKLTGVAAFLGAGALIVSSSLPTTAFAASDIANAATTESAGVQALQVEAGIGQDQPTISRDTYTVTMPPPPPKVRTPAPAAGNGTAGVFARTVNSGTVAWPFPGYVPIISGFGPRRAPCATCSSFHDGIDLVPGAGTPIGAIAPGVVSAVLADAGGYGTHVVVDHVINGQRVQSIYAHMLYGSPTVRVGQPVSVGQILGRVGSTGASTGPHLHLGITVNGVFIDPAAWLRANAG